VTRFFNALNRQALEEHGHGLPPLRSDQAPRAGTHAPSISERIERVSASSDNLVPPALAHLKGIHRITESFAGVASVLSDARLAIAGCAAGDGCSSVAAAIALDLTQRLNVRTLLVDGNICRPRIVKMFASRQTSLLELEARALMELGSAQQTVVRSSNWAKLEVATAASMLEKSESTSLEELNDRVGVFPAAVIDLGTVRLDPRALPLVRPNDPVLLVVRAGYTARSDLLATMNVFSSIGRPVKGVVLNATHSAIPEWIRRWLGKRTEV
jgi:Mrp family chromosome partitioning ATPase